MSTPLDRVYEAIPEYQDAMESKLERAESENMDLRDTIHNLEDEVRRLEERLSYELDRRD